MTRSPWFKRGLLGAVGIAIVALTFVFVLPQMASYREVWAEVKGLEWEWVAALLGVTVLNLVTFAPPWQVALPGLGFFRALMLTQASTALSIVAPAGAAVGMAGSYGLLRNWGFEAAAVARAVTLTGVWNQLANLLFPVVALFWLSLEGGDHPALTVTAFAGVAGFGAAVAVLALVLYSDRLAREVGEAVIAAYEWVRRRLRRRPAGRDAEAFVRFRRDSLGLLRRRWAWLTLATLAGHLTVFAVLVVSLRAFGVEGDEISLAEAFAGWALVRILGVLPLTPGGLGIVELGLTGALVAFGGPNAQVVAAVLVYRFLTVVPTLVLGAAAGATWRLHRPDRTGQGAAR